MKELAKVNGGRIPHKEHRKLNIEDSVEYILDRLIFAKLEDVKDVRKDCMFMPHEMGPLWMRGVGENELLFNHPEEVDDPRLVWPMSVGTVGYVDDPAMGRTIQCNSFGSVPAKVLRGKYRFIGKYNMGFATGRFIEHNQFISSIEYACWSMNRWRSSQRLRFDQAFLKNVPNAGTAPIERYVDKGEDDIGAMCALGQSIALTYRYEWGAQFSIGNSARVVVPTTPQGIRSLFDDRDKPVDRDRRAAIRHWVNEHMRRKPAGSFSSIREHMRGQVKFSWRGFDVEILPSKFDTERVGK